MRQDTAGPRVEALPWWPVAGRFELPVVVGNVDDIGADGTTIHLHPPRQAEHNVFLDTGAPADRERGKAIRNPALTAQAQKLGDLLRDARFDLVRPAPTQGPRRSRGPWEPRPRPRP